MNRYTFATYLRPPLHALLTPPAVVLELGAAVRPAVRRCAHRAGGIELQFESAIADLLLLLDNAKLKGRRVHVWVSDHWSRPLLLPLHGNRPADAEIDILLQTQYRRIYGDMMNAWSWCWDLQNSYLTALAWPETGLAALRAGLNARHCAIASARPLAMDIAAKANLPSQTGWLAIVESQSFTLLHQQNGDWLTWSVTHCGADLHTLLPLQLARLSACTPPTQTAVTLVNTTTEQNLDALRQALAQAGWTTRTWQPPQTNALRSFRLIQAAHAMGSL